MSTYEDSRKDYKSKKDYCGQFFQVSLEMLYNNWGQCLGKPFTKDSDRTWHSAKTQWLMGLLFLHCTAVWPASFV